MLKIELYIFQSFKNIETLYFISTIKYKYMLCLLKLKVITPYFIRVVIDGNIFFIQAVPIQSFILIKVVKIRTCWGFSSLVSPVSLSLLQTLVIFPRSANINHQGTEISQPLSVLPHLGAWEKARFFQNDGLTECKITRFMLLQLTLLKMR